MSMTYFQIVKEANQYIYILKKEIKQMCKILITDEAR